MSQPADTNADEFVYDPNHPMNVEDRANDPDDGIDYDEIIMATEANFRAGRGYWFSSIEEFTRWFEDTFDCGMGQSGIGHATE